jgi:hypothetical protein
MNVLILTFGIFSFMTAPLLTVHNHPGHRPTASFADPDGGSI